MTKIITRFFESADRAKAVQNELLYGNRFPRSIMSVYANADTAAEQLTEARVQADTVKAYVARMKKGGAVLLVRAGYKPLGVAKITRKVTATFGPEDMGDIVEEVKVAGNTGAGMSILPGHEHLMTRRIDSSTRRFYMANWPIPLISRRKPFSRSLLSSRNARMADFPIPLISRRKPYADQIYVNKHQRMAEWPIGLLLPGHKFQADRPIGHLIPGHQFQAGFPIGHLIPGHKFQAKFPFGHLVPGHARMARWPFPLLINEKQGKNALVPGHKFMARFPFDHLIPGHNFQAGFPIGHLIPGHKFQAGFPIGHLIPGHKFQAGFPIAHLIPGHKFMARFPFDHLVPGHKRMANFPIPLIISDTAPKGKFGTSKLGKILGTAPASAS